MAAASSSSSSDLTPSQQLEFYSQVSASIRADGTRDALKQHLRQLLLKDTWAKDIATHSQDVITQRGLQQTTVDQVLASTQQHAQQDVIPANVRKEMIAHIRATLIERSERELQTD